MCDPPCVVDTRGAVLLEAAVPVVEVYPVQVAPILTLERGPRLALKLMFAATVLQALAIHVKRRRGIAFGVDPRDVDVLTVEQLAVVLRKHDGSAGQGFELAISDAVNTGVPGVVRPIQKALAEVGVLMREP